MFIFLDDVEDDQGVSSGVLAKRKRHVKMLDAHIKQHYGKELADLLHNVTELETVMMSYFENLKITTKDGDVQLPKRGYLDILKSNLKMWILAKTHHVVDISSKAQFPRLHKSMRDLMKLCENQRGRSEAQPLIDEATIGKVFGFISYLTDLIESRGTDNYDQMVLQLPHHQRTSYHHLLQCGVVFFLYFFMVGTRRIEAVTKLKTHQFEKRYHEDLDLHYYCFVGDEKDKKGYFSKQPSGIIPFQENKFGCNPGQTFELYLSLLNPASDSILQLPKKPSKRFDVQSPHTTVMYDQATVGKDKVTQLLPEICSAIEIESFSSVSVRKTGAKYLEKFDLDGNKDTALVIRQPKLESDDDF